jgi:hypothetical protein
VGGEGGGAGGLKFLLHISSSWVEISLHANYSLLGCLEVVDLRLGTKRSKKQNDHAFKICNKRLVNKDDLKNHIGYIQGSKN